MCIVCYYLFFITHSSSVEHSIGRWAYQSLVIVICFLCLFLFGSENVALASFPINNINKGRWTQDKHKIFMHEYEKYGNNCMQIARVLSTRTSAQIEKHAECFFKEKCENKSCSSETILRVPLSQWKSTGFSHTCHWTTKLSTVSLTGEQS